MSHQDKLEALVKASQAFQEQPAEMEALWDSCSCRLYSLEDKQKQLGLGDKVGLVSFNAEYKFKLRLKLKCDVIFNERVIGLSGLRTFEKC